MRGWLFGTVDGKTSGIIPANYVKIMGKKVVENKNAEQATSSVRTPSPPSNPSNANPAYSMEQLFNDS